LAGVTTYFLLRRPNGRLEARQPRLDVALGDRATRGCDLSPGSTLMIRRRVWNTIGGSDEQLSRLEDWDLLLRLAAQHNLSVVGEALAVVRLNRPGPSPKVVKASARRILHRHRSRSMNPGPGQWGSAGPWTRNRRLTATYHYEVGLSTFRHGHGCPAALHLGIATVLDPLFRLSVLLRVLGRHRAQSCLSVRRYWEGSG